MTDNRKTVLIMITKSSFGGAQRYVYDLATGLPTNQYRIVVAVGGDGSLRDRLERAGVRTIAIETLQRDISIIKEVRSVLAVAQIIRRLQPDILHLNSSKAGLLGAFVGRVRSVPRIIFTCHGWAFNEDRPGYQRFALKVLHWLTVLLTHQTIAVSHITKEQLPWPGTKSKFTVIHNGRQRPDFLDRSSARSALTELQPELEQYQNDSWSGTISELHPVKQHDVAVKTIARLVADGFAVRHLIISDGEERDQLQQLIAKQGLTHHVFLLGRIEDAARYLKGLDIFIFPSRSEGLPYAVIEAAMAGLPILASNVGGIPEIVTDNRSALLHQSGDHTTLATHFQNLLNDKPLRYRLEQAAIDAGSRFDVTEMLDRTIDCYAGDNFQKTGRSKVS